MVMRLPVATDVEEPDHTLSSKREDCISTHRGTESAVYFNASLISMSRFSISVTNSDRGMPRCWAFPAKYSQTLRSTETGISTLDLAGIW